MESLTEPYRRKALPAKFPVRWTIIAVPVASTNAVERLRRVADDVLALVVDPDFAAVGQYYDEFSQTSDEEVIALLRDTGATQVAPFKQPFY